MKSKSLKPFSLVISVIAIISIFIGCKKNHNKPNVQQEYDEITVVDSAKTIFLAQRDAPDLSGADGPVISAYDAANGTLLHTFKYPHDAGAASYDSYLQYIALRVGNGYLYSIESNKISALNMNTGAVLWKVPIKNNNGATLHDETFYGISFGAVMSNIIENDNNYVYALNATKFTNTYLWKYKISLSGITKLNVPNPIYYRGLVYAMADATHLIALDANTGSLKWTFTFPGNFSTPIVKDGTLYSSVNNIYYLIDAATGAQKKTFTVSDYIGAPVFISDKSIVYQGGAFDLNGILRWQAKVSFLQPFGLWKGNIVARKDSTYIPNYYAGHIPYQTTYALCLINAETGQQKWIKKGYYDSGGSAPLIINNTMYGTVYQKLNALDLNTGNIKWSNAIDNYNIYVAGPICIMGTSGNSYQNDSEPHNTF